MELPRIVAEQPVVLPLPASTSEPKANLALAIIATPHGPDGGQPTPSTIATATRAAVVAASKLGVRSLGIPLLGTGALALQPGPVAEVAVPAAVLAARAGSLKNLVFVCLNQATEAAVRRAWTRESPNELSAAPLPVERPSAAAEPTAGPVGEEAPAEYSTVDLAGGVSTDRVDPNRGIPLGEDQLGVAPYVSMLATVIADRGTRLPLSVGVFGEWGSGKSYFMGLLRQRIKDLAESGGPAYCSTIEQIGFNAWHYADSNLWASLGDEIFRQLADDGSTPERNRRLLLDQMTGQLSQRKALEAATEQARDATAALQAQVDKAIADRGTYARGLLRALPSSSTLRHWLSKLWARLGLGDHIEQGKVFAEQMRGTLDEADALRKSPGGRWGRIALALAAIVLIVGTFAAVFAPDVREWVAAVGGTLFATLASAGIAAMSAARSGLRRLRELAAELHAGAVEPELVDKLRRAEADQRVAEAQRDEVVARIGELGRQLTELSPGHRLYSFLADRAGGDTYTSNLGLISIIRKDFVQLVDLMADWRANPTAPDGTARQPIDRIVLYIDDLDRCSPRQVVAVLQAVHLLLALDLFVVVVGVDPRWLLRSLSSHYDETLQDSDGSDWPATPVDYLEKILNIPMVLPGMPPGSLSNLLRSLVDDVEPVVTGPAATSRVRPAPTVDVPDFPIEAGSELDTQVTDPSPARPRPLGDNEITLLAALDPLIATPREAKRLMNLYRMLRSTRDLSEASHFLGDDERPGEYQAVIVLLGLLTTHARLLGQILDTDPDIETSRLGGLMHRPASIPWSQFVDDLRPRATGDTWTNPIRGHLPEAELRHWTRLHDGMAHVSSFVSIADLVPFQLWTPRIRRFSYVLSPRGQ